MVYCNEFYFFEIFGENKNKILSIIKISVLII